jgi:hypothetical protein
MEDFQEALGGPAFPGGGPWGPAGLLHPPDLPVPERQDHNRAGKKEPTGRRPSRLCQPCATPSSNSSLEEAEQQIIVESTPVPAKAVSERKLVACDSAVLPS